MDAATLADLLGPLDVAVVVDRACGVVDTVELGRRLGGDVYWMPPGDEEAALAGVLASSAHACLVRVQPAPDGLALSAWGTCPGTKLPVTPLQPRASGAIEPVWAHRERVGELLHFPRPPAARWRVAVLGGGWLGNVWSAQLDPSYTGEVTASAPGAYDYSSEPGFFAYGGSILWTRWTPWLFAPELRAGLSYGSDDFPFYGWIRYVPSVAVGLRSWPGANRHVYVAVRYEGTWVAYPTGVLAVGAVSGAGDGFTVEAAFNMGGLYWYRNGFGMSFHLGWTVGARLGSRP